MRFRVIPPVISPVISPVEPLGEFSGDLGLISPVKPLGEFSGDFSGYLSG